ncbi:hypothetical protein AwErysi_05990 [Erysipelotrichaceae bacterium]|nr:hypothetical protein AwErysi_05990 [Erysipelotrichaceae bacterium]
MRKYGLVGKKLSYSYSKIIHTFLIEYYNLSAVYDLIEVDFIDSKLLAQYDGLNITIPYKADVIPFLQKNLSPIAAVNTILKNGDELIGYNTDIIGFSYLVEKLAITDIKKIVILGSGASSKMVAHFFADAEIIVISRNHPQYNYEYLQTITADLLINTTPVGMDAYDSPIPSELLTHYRGIIDINYNPLNSKLGMDAKKQNIPYINGLYMLIIQAVRAFEIWFELSVDPSVVEEIYYHICFLTHPKIALIGMPMSGKTTAITAFFGCDLDDQIIKRSGEKIADMLDRGTFRRAESRTLQALVNEGHKLIALGGGAILNFENLEIIKDYLIIFLNTPLEVLQKRIQTDTRPLLKKKGDLEKLYEKRIPLYKQYANITIETNELEAKLNEYFNN